MKKSVYLAVSTFLVTLILSSPVFAVDSKAADLKIGTVDMQKALQTVDAGRTAKTKLESDFNKKKSELQKEEAEIKKMHEEFQKKSLVMNDKAKAEKQAELQQRIMAFQELTARSQAEIQKREQELTKPIIDKLRDVIQEVAKEKGMSVVLEKNENMVLFSLEKDDITKEVIEAYNKKNKS